MTFQKFAGVTLTAAFMAFGAANPATAATWEYDFGTLVVGKNAPSIADTVTFANLSVSTTDYKDFIYTLTVRDLTSVFGSKDAYVNSLSVDTFTKVDPKQVSNVIGDVSKVALSTDNQKIGAVRYDFTNTIGTSHNELTSKEQVTWTTTYKNALSPNNIFGSSPFVLGVNGIAYETIKKDDGHYETITRTNGSGEYLGRIVSSVPEPESYAMLISGLALLGFIARRRQRSN